MAGGRLTIYLNEEATTALTTLVRVWYKGQPDKRNATIARALLDTAARVKRLGHD